VGEGVDRWRKRFIAVVGLAVLILIACAAFFRIYRVVEINRMAAKVGAARTAPEEAAAFRAVSDAAWWTLPGFLLPGYTVRFFDRNGRPLQRQDRGGACQVEIEWPNGTKVRRCLIDPGNLECLLSS